MNDKVLIWSVEHQAWWSDGGGDYSTDIAAADRYSMKQAVEIIRDAHIGWNPAKLPKEAMIPESALKLP